MNGRPAPDKPMEAKETCVCNVKVAHIRPQYRDLEEWCADPENVYVGRRGVVFIGGARYPPADSPWANPYKVKGSSRAEVLRTYRAYITERLEKEPGLRDALKELRGKTLGCWCAPLPCHADILVELLNALD